MANWSINYGSTRIGQADMPGCDHEPSKLLLQRKSDAPLKPVKPQEPCDLGLFSDEASQTDLVDMARAVETRRTTPTGFYQFREGPDFPWLFNIYSFRGEPGTMATCLVSAVDGHRECRIDANNRLEIEGRWYSPRDWHH